uniref:G protein-coupled receptor kinase 7b n=1 Tax=Sinocyclocheilus anshuiensis TaxID=1608454 RepID=A0A671LR65_9TELE
MCDMGGLDNLVANTAYLKNFTEVHATIPKDFEDICEQEPIGKTSAAEFLDELNDWNSAEAGAKELRLEPPWGGGSCRSQARVKGWVKEATQEFLRGKPFTEYQTSPFFDRFVQWKQFEKQVCAVRVKHTGQMYACKKLDQKRLKKKGGEKMALLEKKILEKVNSLFLVNLAYAFDTTTHLCLVMALMNGGDLKYHIYHTGEIGIEMESIIHCTAQIITGILLLHAMDIVYRDMKPENVLLDNQGCQTWAYTVNLEILLLSHTVFCLLYSSEVFDFGCSRRLQFKTCFNTPVCHFQVTLKGAVCTFLTLLKHKNTIICLQIFKKHACMDDPRKHEFFKSINIHRLEAGLIAPPWVPKPNVVYAKDTGNIRDFSEVKGVEFDVNDEKFFKEFSTGAVPIPWQQEMIDSILFDELNDPNRKKAGPDDDDEQKSKSCTLL